MKILSLEARSYADGRLLVMINDNDHMSIKLSPEENDRLMQVGYDIFASRQQAIAKEIASAQPAALIEFQPASVAPVYDPFDDEIPF